MMSLFRDIHYSIRSLWKSKGFSLTVITTMMVCIAVNTTILTALYRLVLKPLPVNEPEQLVQLFNLDKNRKSGQYSSSSWNQYQDFKERSDLFEGCAIKRTVTELHGFGSNFKRVKGQKVNAEFFDVLGVKPVLGRFFLQEEIDPQSAGKVMVLTQTAWENDFGGDLNVIGTQVPYQDFRHGRNYYTIIGVAPRSMEAFDFETKYFAPYCFLNENEAKPSTRYGAADLWLRLKKGIKSESVLAQIEIMEQRWFESFGDERYGRAKRFEFDLPNPLKESLYLLECGALLFLLLGCFNVMTLFLSRAGQKSYELSIRYALGAEKNALRRLILVESTILIVVAICGSIFLTWTGANVINSYLSLLTPSTLPIEMEWTLLSVIFSVSIIIGVVIGYLPLEILLRSGLLQRVDGSQRTSSGTRFSRKISCMVIGQVAIAFVMLTGAGLLLCSFQNVLAVDLGFKASQIVQGRIDEETIHSIYKNWNDRKGLKQRIYSAVNEIPGVESVSFMLNEFLGKDSRPRSNIYFLRGVSQEEPLYGTSYSVSPEFHSTMDIPIIKGRSFHSEDNAYSIIVDELFVQRYFPDGKAVGTEMWYRRGAPQAGEPWLRIIGVAARANFQGLEQRDGLPIVYACNPINKGADLSYTILLRSSRPIGEVIGEMRNKIREVDPQLPLTYTKPLDKAVDEMLMKRKGITLMLTVFAIFSLILSAVGIYGLLSHDVQQRRREFGIRTSLGATTWEILKLVLHQGIWKVGIGLALGIFGSVIVNQFLQNQLFDISITDPWTYSASLGFLLLITVTASFIPAHQAVKIDPIEALRTE